MALSRFFAVIAVIACTACSASTSDPDAATLTYPFACRCDCLACQRADDAGACTMTGRVTMDVVPCARDVSSAQAACEATCNDVVGTECVSVAGAQQSSVACDVPFDGDGVDR